MSYVYSTRNFSNIINGILQLDLFRQRLKDNVRRIFILKYTFWIQVFFIN